METVIKIYAWLQWKLLYLTTREATEEEVEAMDRALAKLQK